MIHPIRPDHEAVTASARRSSEAFLCGLLAMAVGLLVLLGWLLDVPELKYVMPGWETMKANAAVGFVLAGLALMLVTRRPSVAARWAGRVCASLVGLIGLLTLGQYLSGFDLGIDQWLFRDTADAVGTSPPGRMALTSAMGTMLVGAALLLATARRFTAAVQWLALVTVVIGLLPLTGYLYSGSSLVGMGPYTQMAMHTALLFILLGFGLLQLRPTEGLFREVTGDGTGAWVWRRQWPVAVLGPLALGWCLAWGEDFGLYDHGTGSSLLTVGLSLVLTGLLWSAARRMNRLDAVRRQVEAGLRESEERFRLLVGTLAAVVWVTDGDGRFVEPQTEWEAYTGQSWEEHRDRGWIAAVHPDDRDTFTDRWQTAQAEFQSFESSGRIWCAAANDHRYFEASAAPRISADGTVREWLGSLLDVDEEKRAQDAARQLHAELEQRVTDRTAELSAVNRELEAFSYSVSHDLKAPLRSVDGFARFLEEDYADRLDDEGRRLLTVIRDSAKEMGQLVSDLLAFSRLSRTPLKLTRIDMELLVRDVWERLEDDRAGRQIELRLGPLPMAHGDPVTVREVVVNLLANAVKFSAVRDLAVVEVNGRIVAGRATYEVRDNGAGYDMAYQEKLFGVFQRLHSQAEFEGTGIGLALVQRIVQRHGGQVGAEGAVDRGATFWFTLPVGPDAEGDESC